MTTVIFTFTLGGLNVKHGGATWNLSARNEENHENLCRVGSLQELTDAY